MSYEKEIIANNFEKPATIVVNMELSWIQKHALMVLLRRDSARVRDLIPPDVPANQFAYHLDGLVSAKVIEKTNRGTYALTAEGQKFAGKFSTATNAQTEEIKTVVMLYAKQGNAHLLFRWSRQPYLGKVTPLYDRVPFGKSLEAGKQSACRDKLGHEADLVYRSSALISVIHEGQLISHMNAHIYTVDISETILLYTSRNGRAELISAENVDCMDGVADFLRQLTCASQPFESVWTY